MGGCARPGDSVATAYSATALVSLHLDNSHLLWHAGDAQSFGCLTQPLSVEPGLALRSWFSTPALSVPTRPSWHTASLYNEWPTQVILKGRTMLDIVAHSYSLGRGWGWGRKAEVGRAQKCLGHP